ncbi:MAG: PAS domain S-box protein [Candidatus Lokiarchaeota archaeon]|nr:PAS domain S-box protein [Candidatus Lokiarchaeota archaeon]
MINQEGRIIDCNKATETILGYKKEELISKLLKDIKIISAEMYSKLECKYAGVFDSTIFEPDEMKILRKDGKKLWINSRLYILELENEYITLIIGQDITEKKKAEIKLNNSKEKYHDLFSNSPLGIFILDDKGNLIDSNEKSKIIFSHLSLKEYYGKNFANILSDFKNSDELKAIFKEWNNLWSIGENVVPIDIKFIEKDGKEKWLQWQSSMLNLKKKTIFKIIIQDITERKLVEIRLKESEDKFKTISDQTMIGICIVQDGVFKYLNSHMETLTGYTINEMTSWNANYLFNLVAPEFLDTVKEQKKKKELGLNDVTPKYEIRGIQKSGKEIWVENYSKHLIYKGKPAILAIFIDITEKKKAEKALEESEITLKTAVESLPFDIFILNKNKECTLQNTASREFWGNVIGKTPEEVASNSEILDIWKENNDRALSGQITKKEIKIKIEEKEKYLYNIISPIKKDDNIRGILGVNIDITDQKNIQNKLKESEKKYREAYRKANLYEDLFAHDVNNILQNIKSSIELSKIYLNEPNKFEKIREFFGIIEEQIIRGSNLVSNVVKLFKMDDTLNIPIEEVDLISSIKKAVDFVRQSHQIRNLSIKTEIYENNTTVKANNFLIDIFENILFNAVMYNDNILIKIRIKVQKYEKDNSFFKIEFIDNGRGISNRRKKIIFGENIEGKRKGGMGLGLSLVKKILESYNGRIWVEDRIEGDFTQGSDFIILIPESD